VLYQSFGSEQTNQTKTFIMFESCAKSIGTNEQTLTNSIFQNFMSQRCSTLFKKLQQKTLNHSLSVSCCVTLLDLNLMLLSHSNSSDVNKQNYGLILWAIEYLTSNIMQINLRSHFYLQQREPKRFPVKLLEINYFLISFFLFFWVCL
jgi:hypothetical protein